VFLHRTNLFETFLGSFFFSMQGEWGCVFEIVDLCCTLHAGGVSVDETGGGHTDRRRQRNPMLCFANNNR
jgi:hypothetical protein